MLSRLPRALAAMGGPAWIELVGDDQVDRFALLLADLRRKHSATGNGKRITSGYAYTGVEPALAWASACSDRLYPVMKQSIESFGSRWAEVRGSLGTRPFHLVSLGPGDGQKDAVLLRDLRQGNDRLCYVSVDASTEMLRLAVRDLIVRQNLSGTDVLSVPWDFSVPGNVVKVRRLLTELLGDAPVLFSLLGNTLANFDDDTRLLRTLTQLLRPQDRLLLELTTAPYLDGELAGEAAAEYERSRSFGEWVTSALRRYTDLHVEQDSVRYEGVVETERALLVKMIYQNQTGADISFKLPDGDSVRFRAGDTIRLNLTRKYTKKGLDTLLAKSALETVHSVHADFTATEHNRPGFGMELMTLSVSGAGPTQVSRADALWTPSPT